MEFKIFKNKQLWRLLLIVVFQGLFLSTSVAQEKTVTGVVSDELGATLPGVQIVVKGTTIGTITDLDGKYTIEIPQGQSALMFSFMGMATQTIDAVGKTALDVVMRKDVNNLDEIVVIGYGAQKSVSVTGSVNTIRTDELTSSGSSSVATALTGKLPGTVVVQNSGEAGAGASDIRIRGGDYAPLILVDGIERGFEDLDPDEIESISILKDASATAVYGLRGGDGVIIVKTKRGKDGPAKITLKTEFGLSTHGKLPEYLDSYNYAKLYNQGRINDGQSVKYTDDDLALFESGADPVLHPSHNWHDDLTNDFGYRQRYSINISGGHQKMRYFASAGYYNERDVFKDFDVGYDDRSYYKRYNLRTNLDIDLSTSSVLSVNLSGQFSNRHKPNVDFKDLNQQMFLTAPDASTLVDGKIRVRDGMDQVTPLEMLYDRGYQDNHTNKMQFSTTFKQNLEFITKGLSFDATVSYDHTYTNNFKATKNLVTYIDRTFKDVDGLIGDKGTAYPASVDAETGALLNPITGEIIENPEDVLLRDGSESRLQTGRSTGTKNKVVNLRTKLNYSREFGDHTVGAVAVFTTNEIDFLNKDGNKNNPLYAARKYVEGAARLSYNYADKYFVEFNGGINGSENFAPDKRYGFFPAISGGWVPSNEDFFPKNDILTFLKLRGSYGTTGNDKDAKERFLYYDAYNISYSGGYRFGLTSPTGQGSANESKIGNPDVTWSRLHKQNYAIETKWFEGKLVLQGEYFYTKQDQKLQKRNNIAGIINADIPAVNIGEQEMEGFEIEGSYTHKFGALKLRVHGNYSYADKRVVYKDEIQQQYDWQVETGQHPKVITGYVSDGFYTSEEIDFLKENEWQGTPDIPYSQTAGDKLQAGDLKYVDLNKDGVVDDKDKKVFTNLTIPRVSYSFGLSGAYKGFEFSCFFQGVGDVTYAMSRQFKVPFVGGFGNAPAYVLDHWTEERAARGDKITFPRISAKGETSSHNAQSSDFWFRDASFLRLKNVEVAYKLKNSYLENLGISSVRIYANGNNLYTWTDLDLIDPEAKAADKAPIPPNKVYTMGVNVSF